MPPLRYVASMYSPSKFFFFEKKISVFFNRYGLGEINVKVHGQGTGGCDINMKPSDFTTTECSCVWVRFQNCFASFLNNMISTLLYSFKHSLYNYYSDNYESLCHLSFVFVLIIKYQSGTYNVFYKPFVIMIHFLGNCESFFILF